MKQRTRLLRYLVPYWWQLIPGLLLMAGVGTAGCVFASCLMRPVFDGVLKNPGEVTHTIPLFKNGLGQGKKFISSGFVSLPFSECLDSRGVFRWSLPRY